MYGACDRPRPGPGWPGDGSARVVISVFIYAHTVEIVQALIRRARASSGLSVRALAQRADVSPSTITRIEAGTVDPTFGMVTKILEAADHHLRMTITRRPTPPSPLPSARPVRLADLADAWKEAAYGLAPDWTRFRATLDQLARHPEAVPAAIRERPAASGSIVTDALLAGVADKLADDGGFARPSWTQQAPTLDREWAMPGTPQMIASRRAATPVQLRDRGLVVDVGSLWRDRTTVDG